MLLAGGDLVANAASSPERINFHSDIRPLLSDRCFNCHGPDRGARKARLRLDTVEGAMAVLDEESGLRVLHPGRPDLSEAYRRIVTEDPDDLMPPPDSKLTLSAEEQALIRRWIEEGADYRSHWSFTPIEAFEPPEPQDAVWERNPIDTFVLARLRKEGLRPSAEASREALIRRLSFDLTGLPPTLEEIETFLGDKRDDAYARLVDRLLAAPAYGEQRALEWLDLARYADTYGYQSDVDRDMSPWRDWVIHAFNENLPYDQFITWQLAGDLLPEASKDQVLATAFNRLHRQTNEGGSINEEFRVEYVADRVHTFGTAFLGVTLECARCHDHKFDPITQRDYYGVFAFFNRIDESGLYSHFTRATPSPTLLLYPEGVEAEHARLREAIRAEEERLAAISRSAQTEYLNWLESAGDTVIEPRPVAVFDFETVADGTTPDSVDPQRRGHLVDGPVPAPGPVGQALKFSGDNSAVFQGVAAFDRATPFSFGLWLKPETETERAVVFHRSRAWTDSGSRGYELVLEELRPAFGLIHFWPGNAIQVRAREPLAVDVWTHLTITYDGSSRADGLRLYANGAALATEVIRDGLRKDILHRREWGDADVGNVHLTLAGRFRDSGFRGGAIDEFKVFDRCLTAPEVRLLSGASDSTSAPTGLREHFLRRFHPAYRAGLEELARLREQENAVVNDVPEIMVMRDMPEPRPTYVLKRGGYDQRGDRVEPGTPALIFPFPERLPRDRLGLARWLTNPRNPLTARVAVNRVWQSHFGRGLVETSEDFGSQGRLPSHPALLDWLAAEFVRSGWDLKALHRLVATSATYRQTSRATGESFAHDPENLLLSRGPRHRLSAETIRDHALAVSGLLNRNIGGPSVKPYQPPGLWRESGTGKTYTPDRGEKLHRRSLYTFWRRTAPPPNMLTFDAGSREVCAARRESTRTPLQALVLLNDPQFLEAARVLAERLTSEYLDAREPRVETAFRRVIGRAPEERERAILLGLLGEQLDRFREDEAAAEAFLRVGQAPQDLSLPLAEVAATMMLTHTLMNLDEFVVKY